MPSNAINDFEKSTSKENEPKRWKGLRQDKSGNYLVYVTDTSERLFSDLDSAVAYLKEAAKKEDFKKEASNENAVVQRGQENLEGLKEVITRKKLVQTADGKYKVMESKRYNMKSDDSEDAKNKLKDVDTAKEQTSAVEEEDALEEIKEENTLEKKSSLKYGPIGTCLHCHASIYPPNTDMDYWFNRQLPADLYCPACGYGIGTPGNFNYTNALMNEQSVDNLTQEYRGACVKVSSLNKEASEKFANQLSGANTEIDQDSILELLLSEGISWPTDHYIEIDNISGELNWAASISPSADIKAEAIKATVEIDYRDATNSDNTGSIKFDIDFFDNETNITGNNIGLQLLKIYGDKTAFAKFGSI